MAPEETPMDQPPKDDASRLQSLLDAHGLDDLAAALASMRADQPPEPAPEPIWPNEPLYTSFDDLQDFAIRNPRSDRTTEYRFWVPKDWSHLAAPLILLPPDILPDPLLKEWAWLPGVPFGSRESVLRFAHKMADNPPTVGFVPKRSKGQDAFLKAAASLREKHDIIPVAVLAKKAKLSLGDAMDRIHELKTYGEWPHPIDMSVGDIVDGDDVTAAEEILVRLGKLPCHNAVLRAVNMVVAAKPWRNPVETVARPEIRLPPYKRRIIDVALTTSEPRTTISLDAIAKTLKRDRRYLKSLISLMKVNREWPNELLDIGEALDEKGRPKPKKVRKKAAPKKKV